MPTAVTERAQILDALRGFALIGIALANFSEFSLWSFLSPEQQAALRHSAADSAVQFALSMFVDGKFYTLFSLLFGVGFSLILSRHGKRLFLRRMIILMAIGAAHLMLLWSGDILLLYAVCGLLLMPLSGLSDRSLLAVGVTLLVLPIGLDAMQKILHTDWAAPCYEAWWQSARSRGIDEANFATWLARAENYPQMFDFLVQGAHERVWEFVSGHRLPKVLGLFVLGYLAGRRRLYARLPELPLARCLTWTLAVGLPLSALYALSATGGHPWGRTVHSMLYTASVFPLGFAYVCGISLLMRRRPSLTLWRTLAAPGRMALTCYIGQTIFGISLFYGIGLGYGAQWPLACVEFIAFCVFLIETFICQLWLRTFQFGPLEWVWRMLTYGRWFSLRKI